MVTSRAYKCMPVANVKCMSEVIVMGLMNMTITLQRMVLGCVHYFLLAMWHRNTRHRMEMRLSWCV